MWFKDTLIHTSYEDFHKEIQGRDVIWRAGGKILDILRGQRVDVGVKRHPVLGRKNKPWEGFGGAESSDDKACVFQQPMLKEAIVLLCKMNAVRAHLLSALSISYRTTLHSIFCVQG